jgi:citrate synthase
MFTVMFALGRLPGWIAQWKEMREDPKTRIARPRQIYTGATERRPLQALPRRGLSARPLQRPARSRRKA